MAYNFVFNAVLFISSTFSIWTIYNWKQRTETKRKTWTIWTNVISYTNRIRSVYIFFFFPYTYYYYYFKNKIQTTFDLLLLSLLISFSFQFVFLFAFSSAVVCFFTFIFKPCWRFFCSSILFRRIHLLVSRRYLYLFKKKCLNDLMYRINQQHTTTNEKRIHRQTFQTWENRIYLLIFRLFLFRSFHFLQLLEKAFALPILRFSPFSWRFLHDERYSI